MMVVPFMAPTAVMSVIEFSYVPSVEEGLKLSIVDS